MPYSLLYPHHLTQYLVHYGCLINVDLPRGYGHLELVIVLGLPAPDFASLDWEGY